MSVSELVRNREDLMGKIKEIDDILKEAVNAYGASLPSIPRPDFNQQLSTSPITQSGRTPDNILFGDRYKPPITPTQPVQPQQQSSRYPGNPLNQNQTVQPVIKDSRNPFAGDAQSGFQLFDTDTYVAEQNALSMQYADTEYDVEGMNNEVAELKQQISEGIESVRDSEATDGNREEDISSIA